MLRLRDGMLQGTLNGMLVNCPLRPGVSIPRGTYRLLPAVQDPVFGALVMMVPAGGRANPFTGAKMVLSSSRIDEGQSQSSLSTQLGGSTPPAYNFDK